MSATPAGDLFARTEQEDWLLRRLTQLRAKVDGVFPTLKDRLKHVIESQGFEVVIAGRRPDGKPENFLEAWERIYGEAFHVKPNRRGKR